MSDHARGEEWQRRLEAENRALLAERDRYREALERIKVGDYTVIMEWSQESLQRELATIKAIASKALALTKEKTKGT